MAHNEIEEVMHTTQTKIITFIHNGDYSGDVIVVIPKAQLEECVDPTTVRVKVPFNDLKAFIAEYARRTKISELEDMSSDEILGSTHAL